MHWYGQNSRALLLNQSGKTHTEVVPVDSKTMFRGNERRNAAPGMWHRAAWWHIPVDNFLHSQRLTASKLTMKQANYGGKLNRDVVTSYAVKECKRSRGIAPVIPNLGNKSKSVKRHLKSVTSESEEDT